MHRPFSRWLLTAALFGVSGGCGRDHSGEIAELRQELKSVQAETAALQEEVARLKANPRPDSGILVQEDEFRVRVGLLEVIYPRPYANPPALKITDDGDLTDYVIEYQRTTGFGLRVAVIGATGKPAKYQARGLPAKE